MGRIRRRRIRRNIYLCLLCLGIGSIAYYYGPSIIVKLEKERKSTKIESPEIKAYNAVSIEIANGQYIFKTNEHLLLSIDDGSRPCIYINSANDPTQKAKITFSRNKAKSHDGMTPSTYASYDRYLRMSQKANNKRKEQAGGYFSWILMDRYRSRWVGCKEALYCRYYNKYSKKWKEEYHVWKALKGIDAVIVINYESTDSINELSDHIKELLKTMYIN